MGRLRPWIDWSVLALCMAAAAGAVAYGVGALDVGSPAHGVHGHPASRALAVIAALTVVNCGFLIGAAVCKARQDVRLGRRQKRRWL
jgi:hypothetical protein